MRSILAALVLAAGLGGGAGCSGRALRSEKTGSSSAPSSTVPTTAAPSTRPPTSTAPAPSTGPPTTALRHVLIVVLENHEAPDALAHMPYLSALAASGGEATQSYARGHPSLPNYLELIAGQTFGITDDCTSCTVSGPNLAAQLDGAGIPWRAYMEGLATPCPRVASTGAGYAKKHDPFAYFPDVLARDCNQIVPSGRLLGDLEGASPPDFAWLTPDLCHDAHDCALGSADGYLRDTLGPVLSSAWYRSGGAVIVTFDEGSSNAGCCDVARGGHVATVVVSTRTRAGSRLDTPVDHAGTLATIEDLYGLPRLADATCPCAGSLLPLLGG